MSRTVAFRLCSLLVFALVSCKARPEAASVRRPAEPQVTDSLYRIVRRMLTVRNPAAMYYAQICETGRILDSLGEKEGMRRINAMLDTAYSKRDDAASARVEELLATRVFEVEPSPCDTLDRIVRRADSMPDPPRPRLPGL